MICEIVRHPHAQVRQLHAAKVRAVQAENYEEAKRLKGAIEQLKQVNKQYICNTNTASTQDTCFQKTYSI